MKLLSEEKPNFDEKLTVEITVKELLIIYASLATSNSEKIGRWFEKYKEFKPIEYEVESRDIPYLLYCAVSEILKKKGFQL